MICFPLPWTFWDYGEGDRNYIADWYKGISEGAQATFDGILKNARKIENPREWGAKALAGENLRGLFEFRFFDGGIQHRVLWTFGNERKRVILLIGCYHKMTKYTPHDALNTAATRASAYRNGKARTYERPIENNQ